MRLRHPLTFGRELAGDLEFLLERGAGVGECLDVALDTIQALSFRYVLLFSHGT